MPLMSSPLFCSLLNGMMKTSLCLAVASVLPDVSLSSSDSSGPSWGGPALASLKGRSATLSVLRASAGASLPPSLPSFGWEMENVLSRHIWKRMLQLKFCTKMRFAGDGTLQFRSLAHDTTSSRATKWKIFNGKRPPSNTCTLLDSITDVFVLLQLHWLYFIKDHVICLTEFTKGTGWKGWIPAALSASSHDVTFSVWPREKARH